VNTEVLVDEGCSSEEGEEVVVGAGAVVEGTKELLEDEDVAKVTPETEEEDEEAIACVVDSGKVVLLDDGEVPIAPTAVAVAVAIAAPAVEDPQAEAMTEFQSSVAADWMTAPQGPEPIMRPG
jgi:hypothetical protein